MRFKRILVLCVSIILLTSTLGFAASPDNQALQSGVKSQAVLDSKKAEKDQAPLLSDVGTTYAMAQVSAFISDDYYAVGRWDGSLNIYNFTPSPDVGSIITKAVSTPAHEGVQMIVPLAPYMTAFISSNSNSSIAVWKTDSGNWADLNDPVILNYNSSYGVANRGAITYVDKTLYLVIGHENGFVSIWKYAQQADNWSFVRGVDVCSSKPVNPWGLCNVRGVVEAEPGIIITGSEDGNLTVLQITTGKILSATVYNSDAKRGINNIAIKGNNLLVANCSVGENDFNLWSYSINRNTWNITLSDRKNLKVNSSAPQVYNFDVIFAPDETGDSTFFSATGEGALWYGNVDSHGTIHAEGYKQVNENSYGAALCISGNKLAVTTYDLREFIYSEID